MAVRSADMNIMVRAAEKAARALLRDFGEIEQLQVSRKGPADFASAADRRAEEIIYEELHKARPSFGFLMEESGEHKGEDGEHRFVVDPLDGTTNFLHGLPHWAISIGLMRGNEIIAGLVYDPVKDEMYTAEKGGGAFLRRQRLRVSGRRDLSASLIACGSPHPGKPGYPCFLAQAEKVLQTTTGFRRYGAAALDLAYVAAGRFEGYFEYGIHPWDVCAGILIVREAGGRVGFITDDRAFSGDYDMIPKHGLLATNTVLHDEIKSLLRKAVQE